MNQIAEFNVPKNIHIYESQRLWWSSVSLLAFSTQFRWFKPGQSCRIFNGEKNPQYAFFRRGSKAFGPMS